MSIIEGTGWTSQPQFQSGLDAGNPIAQGISLVVSPPWDGNCTKVGTLVRGSAKGFLRGFSSLGFGLSDRVATQLATTSTRRSYLLIATQVGAGGAGFGRLVTQNDQHMILATSAANISFQAAFSGSSPQWTMNGALGTTPKTLIVTYDGSSTSNNPKAWANGAAVTVGAASPAPSGTLTNVTSPLNIGNRASDGARVWDGTIGLVVVWDRILSDAEVQSLTVNPWQIFAPLPRRILAPAAAGGVYTLTADAGSYAISGQDAALLIGRVVTADAGSYALAGQDASLLKSKLVTADAGAYVVAGQDATLTYTPASGSTYTLIADAGSYALAGQDAALLLGRVVTADAGSYLLAGQDAVLSYAGLTTSTVADAASASRRSTFHEYLDRVKRDELTYLKQQLDEEESVLMACVEFVLTAA